LVYENGWGKVFGSVFEIRSDGRLFPVTEKYSEETATITIFAEDGNGNPLDGADILLGVQQIGSDAIYVDSWSATDSDGKAVFVVGEGRTYYARMTSSIGTVPAPGSVNLLVENAEADGEYSALFAADGVIPVVDILPSTIPEDDEDDYRLEVEFRVANEMVTGTIPMDDYEPTTFYSPENGGQINCFSCDVSNFQMYEAGILCFGFHTFLDSSEAQVIFDIPAEQDWYTVLANGFNLRNAQHVQAKIRLWHYGESPAETEQSAALILSELSNYPNPFNPETTIQFSLPQSGKVDLTIYNSKGQQVKTLVLQESQAGQHSVIWNGKNANDENVASGLYFYQLSINGQTQAVKKMMLMK